MSSGNWKNHKYLYTKDVTTKDGNHYTRYYYEVTGKNGKKSKVSYVNSYSDNPTKDEQRQNEFIDKANEEGGDRKRGLSNYDLMRIEEAHDNLKSGQIKDVLTNELDKGDYKAFANTGKYYAETFSKELVGNLKGDVSDAKDFISGLLS